MLIPKTPAVPLISFRSDSTTTNNQHNNQQPHNSRITTNCYDVATVMNVPWAALVQGPVLQRRSNGEGDNTMANMKGATKAGPKTNAAFMQYFSRLDKGSTTKMDSNTMKRVQRERAIDDELEKKMAKKMK